MDPNKNRALLEDTLNTDPILRYKRCTRQTCETWGCPLILGQWRVACDALESLRDRQALPFDI